MDSPVRIALASLGALIPAVAAANGSATVHLSADHSHRRRRNPARGKRHDEYTAADDGVVRC